MGSSSLAQCDVVPMCFGWDIYGNIKELSMVGLTSYFFRNRTYEKLRWVSLISS